MNRENYERTVLIITEFDAGDVIATSDLNLDDYEGGIPLLP